MSVESYMHKAAKNVVTTWLREIAAEACAKDSGNPGVTFGGFYWRVNRGAPHYGVWQEYPVGKSMSGFHYDRDGLCPVWDEDDYDERAGCSPWDLRPPSYEELVGVNRPPEFVLDVAVQHKGSIVAALEIVHKHPPSERKIQTLRSLNMSVAVVPARWVLGQVCRPNGIPLKFWM